MELSKKETSAKDIYGKARFYTLPVKEEGRHDKRVPIEAASCSLLFMEGDLCLLSGSL